MGNLPTSTRRHTRDTLRVAAYLEEAGEDPAKSCDTLLSHNIRYVALRQVWTGNICNLPDTACQKLRKILTDKDMTAILIASDLGQVPADSLSVISEEEIDHAFNLASYFKAPFIRIGIGTISSGDCISVIDQWMSRITAKAISANITPVLEISNKLHINSPSGLANQLLKHRRWKIIYDPVQLILDKNQDPFVKYWTLLKSSVIAIDVRDLKIGRGFKPVGFGDAKIDYTIRDSLGNNYRGWYLMEPSLGRRHGSALTKQDTFQMALDAFDTILE
jgi:hypothetical protein